jgi:ribosomal protein L11 methyltransferase
VVALDIDPVTGPCLRENQALNPLPPGCRFQPFVGELSSLEAEARFDVIICNMIRTELWPFREELRSRLKPGGRFVVSGQRQEDKPHFLSWRNRSPFEFTEERSLDAWWGFSARAD